MQKQQWQFACITFLAMVPSWISVEDVVHFIQVFSRLHSPANHNHNNFSKGLSFFLENNGVGGASKVHREMFCVIKHEKYKYFLMSCFLV